MTTRARPTIAPHRTTENPSGGAVPPPPAYTVRMPGYWLLTAPVHAWFRTGLELPLGSALKTNAAVPWFVNYHKPSYNFRNPKSRIVDTNCSSGNTRQPTTTVGTCYAHTRWSAATYSRPTQCAGDTYSVQQ